jgi:hypothetical protein
MDYYWTTVSSGSELRYAVAGRIGVASIALSERYPSPFGRRGKANVGGLRSMPYQREVPGSVWPNSHPVWAGLVGPAIDDLVAMCGWVTRVAVDAHDVNCGVANFASLRESSMRMMMIREQVVVDVDAWQMVVGPAQ